MTKCKQNAEDIYSMAHHDCCELLDSIRERLFEMPAPGGEARIDWAHAGSVQHIANMLRAIETFLK